MVSIFLQTFNSLIIRTEFYLNRAYIAKNLCENVDKPMMNCNGKCYLNKKLKQQQKQDQQAPVSKTEKFDVAPFFVPKPFTLAGTASFIKPTFFIKDESLAFSSPNSIFHPPSA
jgi:hypothetical protein